MKKLSRRELKKWRRKQSLQDLKWAMLNFTKDEIMDFEGLLKEIEKRELCIDSGQRVEKD